MKNLGLYLMILAPIVGFGQSPNKRIQELWTTIEQQEQAHELKSMLPNVQEVLTLSKKNKDYSSLLKAMFYEARINITTKDEKEYNINSVIAAFENERKKASSTYKGLLDVYITKIYELYYTENKYKIRNRSTVEKVSSSDVRFWNTQDFLNQIEQGYQGALGQLSKDKKAVVGQWEELFSLDTDISVDFKQLTLYDALRIDYLNYLKGNLWEFNDEDRVQVVLRIEQLKSDVLTDVKQSNGSRVYHYVQLYFLQQSSIEDEEKKKVIEEWIKNNPKESILYEGLATYVEGEELVALSNKVQELFPNTPAATRLASLKKDTEAPSLSFVVKQYLIDNKTIPTTLSHKNLDKVYVQVLQAEEGTKDNYSKRLNSFEDYQKTVAKNKVVDTYEIALKKFTDYKNHTTTVALKTLPKGNYLVVMSSHPFENMQEGEVSVVVNSVNVTPYFIAITNDKVKVFERESGKAAANIEVAIANRPERSNDKSYWETNVKTNSNGEFALDFVKQSSTLYFNVKGDLAYYTKHFYKNDEPTKTVAKEELYQSMILTDRAIYRPGQVLYFKGIVSKNTNGVEAVAVNKNVEVSLEDANGDEVSSLSLKTNEYGSVNGSFVLPSRGVLGEYSVIVVVDDQESSTKYVSVEEYKRPKFEISIDKPSDVYKFNEEVKVAGKVQSFTGAAVDQAKIVYRVERTEVWPYWLWSKRMPSYDYNVETIAQGETTVDGEGKYTVSFKAVPKIEKQEKDNPRTYQYNVYVDAVDSNGETYSVNETVTVGDKNLQLSTNLMGNVTVNTLSKFEVSTKNLNHIDYASKGELAIYALEAPYAKRLLDKQDNRYTDYELYSYEDFVKQMPYTVYNNELDTEKWKEGKLVFSTNFDTGKSKTIAFDGAKALPTGTYVVKGFVLENGDKTELNEKIFFVNNQVTSGITDLVSLIAEGKKYKAGDKAKVYLQSGEEGTQVVVTVTANGEEVQRTTLTIGQKRTAIEVPMKKSYEHVLVQVYGVKHNFYNLAATELELDKNVEELNMTLSSFRDKIEPGAQEKWILNITGKNKEKIAAEVLATMYDASLNKFNENQFFGELKRPIPFYGYGKNYLSDYDFNGLTSKEYGYNVSQVYPKGTPLKVQQPLYFRMFGYDINSISAVGIGSTKRNVRSNKLDSDYSTEHRSLSTAAPTILVEGKAAGVSVQNSSDATSVVTTINENPVSIRKNLQETAFFYPTLRTDEQGNVKIEFTAPEALTAWKFMAFGHTKDLKQTTTSKVVRTQKDLMVVPNLPRFMRQGDVMSLSTKVINMSVEAQKGTATLQLYNAYTNEVLSEKEQVFDIKANASTSVNWDVATPEGVDVVLCRVIAKTAKFSDGEEVALPVLTNKVMVTETMPVYVKEGQNKLFTFEQYEKEFSKVTDNYKLTFELTANPMWTALFALPEIKGDVNSDNSANAVVSKVFANAVASHILNSNPRIKTVFDQWNAKDQLVSKLNKNTELQSILVSETPWVKEAESETERMRRLALLFDLNTMSFELKQAVNQLAELQNGDGGFSWFNGGSSDSHITQSVLEGLGTLKKMGVLKADNLKDVDQQINAMTAIATKYIDEQQYALYQKQAKNKKDTEQAVFDTHYLYVRSLFMNDYGVNEVHSRMFASMRKSLEGDKVSGSLYQQALRATIAKRLGLNKTAQEVAKYIVEAAVESEDLGMYWKENTAGWLWYQSPIETQVAIMEALNEVDGEKYAKQIELMKVWLMKNKQTTSWGSSKATTKAVYAMLNIGKSWMDSDKGVEVKVAGYPIDVNTEAQMGSGYIKKSWSKAEMTAKKGVVELTKTSPGIAYGAMYWQYFEDAAMVKATTESAVGMKKGLFVKTNTDKGQVLRPITTESLIKVGDIVTVRLELTVDNNMDYVHLKDMRASGFEPTNVLSGYQWKNEFSYYQETRDVATNFFISHLRKGTYVFEYDLRANISGTFSNGITTLQSIYAPEMNSHSEGVRVEIKN
ncbi:MAG: hypothetical protein LBI73_00310 [Myroides sp.]|jgi:uncharacterized protein YfaS (alpha-2-macroglobulin family)|nr:hypothetical protein [Myroides sp.]